MRFISFTAWILAAQDTTEAEFQWLLRCGSVEIQNRNVCVWDVRVTCGWLREPGLPRSKANEI